MTHEAERYFRDTHDHLIRISGLIDTYRDLLTASTDVFLSTVSNRQNAVMKQLTVISTVFLPLSFISGFFGQNFDWMIGHLSSWAAFVALGIGLELVAVLLMVVYFKRRSWF
jgi:magnesium transporter